MHISKISGILLLAATASLGACADPTKGIPFGYAVQGNRVLSPEDVVYQDQVVAPRCREWAEQTNPSAETMGAANAWNGLAGGLVGGGAGSGAGALILGAPITVASIASAGAATALPSAAIGGMQGYTYGKVAILNGAKSCVIMDAAGLHLVPPSEGREIVESGEGRSYARVQPTADSEQGDNVSDDVASTLLIGP